MTCDRSVSGRRSPSPDLGDPDYVDDQGSALQGFNGSQEHPVGSLPTLTFRRAKVYADSESLPNLSPCVSLNLGSLLTKVSTSRGPSVRPVGVVICLPLGLRVPHLVQVPVPEEGVQSLPGRVLRRSRNCSGPTPRPCLFSWPPGSQDPLPPTLSGDI